MLAFYPILPKVVEIHTKAYLKMIKALTGSVDDIDEAIRVVFGERGLKIYDEFQRNNKSPILPIQIFYEFLEKKDIEKGIKLTSEMFFDRSQRSLSDSDKFRASVILAIPEILITFASNKHRQFRTRLISMLSNQTIIDQAIPSQMAFVETALYLLAQAKNKRNMKEQKKLEAIYKSIEAKIKAELAGKASAFTAPILKPTNEKGDDILLSEVDEHNLKEVLLLLSLSPAPEINQKAREAIKVVEQHLN
jgi:hypothetical protein